MPLVLLHAGAGVVARLHGLLAEAAVQARARQALVQVGVAQPPSPAGAAAGKFGNILLSGNPKLLPLFLLLAT